MAEKLVPLCGEGFGEGLEFHLLAIAALGTYGRTHGTTSISRRALSSDRSIVGLGTPATTVIGVGRGVIDMTTATTSAIPARKRRLVAVVVVVVICVDNSEGPGTHRGADDGRIPFLRECEYNAAQQDARGRRSSDRRR